MKKLSIIVPIYNSDKYLERCINSIINQTYKNLEIILINDGSTDNSDMICNQYANKDSRIKYINIENGGVSAARNIGLKKAIGDYITFVDSDDWIELSMYEDMIAHIENNKADFCACGVYFEHINGSIIEKSLTSKEIRIESSRYFLERIYTYKDLTLNLWNVIIKRDKTTDLYLDEEIWLGEDNLFILEMLNRIDKGVLINQYYYHYIQYEKSLSHDIKISKKTFSGLLSVEAQANILKEKYPDLYEEYKYIILRNYVNTCREMSQAGFKERKWVKFMKGRIRKELINGGMTCQNHIRKSVINGILICISFNVFYYIYRFIHRREIRSN